MKKTTKFNKKNKLLLIIFFIVTLLLILFISFNFFSKNSLKQSEVYKITIQAQNSSFFEEKYPISSYLAKKLNIKETSNIFFTGPKTTDSISDLNTKELYFVPNNKYPTINQYQDNEVSIKLVAADSSIKTYISNPLYCQQNSDCTIQHICSDFISNKYQPFSEAYGCEQPEGEYDETNKCYRKAIYSDLKCQNNVCIGKKVLDKKCVSSNY